MPNPATVQAFIDHVLSGDHVGAIRDWYHADASMQENQAEPRLGRELLMQQEAATLARVDRVETELLAPPLIDGDQVAIRWRFTFHPPGAPARRMEEVAWQTWRDDKVAEEVFFYDPKQMGR